MAAWLHLPRCLWHVIDYHRGQVLAYVFRRRQDEVFLKLKALLELFGLMRYRTDWIIGAPLCRATQAPSGNSSGTMFW